MSDKGRASKFLGIEMARGVAALLVVLHHAGNIIEQKRFFGAQIFGGHLKNFNVGVDFFFVLSGFIIAWVHWKDLGKIQGLASYFEKRFLRVYPAYWGILLPLIALYIIFPGAGKPSQHDIITIFTSILLVPNVNEPVLGVAWTLIHEITFYIVFSICIVFGRKSLILFLFWAILIFAYNLTGRRNFPLDFIFSPFNLEFIIGVGSAILLKQRDIRMPLALLILGSTAFVGCMLFGLHLQDNSLIGRLAFGLSAGLIVVGLVATERSHPWRPPSGLLVLGASSYAIYLIHPPMLSLGIQLLHRGPQQNMPLVYVFVVLVLAAVGAGIAYHRVAEPRLTRAVRRLIRLPGNIFSGGVR